MGRRRYARAVGRIRRQINIVVDRQAWLGTQQPCAVLSVTSASSSYLMVSEPLRALQDDRQA
jgi:hypothetical protein